MGDLMMQTVLALLALAALPAGADDRTVLYHNATFYTLDAAIPKAAALAVRSDRILAVGALEDLRTEYDAAERVDLGGKTVLPGLIDAHGHLLGLGSFGLGKLDFSRCRSFDEVVAMVSAKAKTAKKGEWILGGRWDHESWPEKRLPTHAKLSDVTPDNPVWITRVDGHAGLANAAAMKLAGVTRDTKAPEGGEILRDERGEPTGVFVDNAEDLIARKIDQRIADTEALLLKAQQMCFEVGLTSVHDAGISPADAVIYRKLAESGKLKLRVYAMMGGDYARVWFAENPPFAGERLSIRAAKLYMDGAMGSRGAWLLEPYADRPIGEDGKPYTGLNLMKPEFVRQVAEDGLRRGYQVCTHAIGDRGNREILDAYADALGKRPSPDARFRVEHAQLLHADDIGRFARLGVIASMQPTHCTSDMRWVEARVGAERARGAYAWQSVLRSGARLAFGSDFPVESHNPLLGVYAAVTRMDPQGNPEGGWYPEQRLTREQALRAFTQDAAFAGFQESLIGSLTPGKQADFIVLDQDVVTCEPAAILQAKVLRTVVGGETVFERRE